MANAPYDPHENIPYALRSGVLTALLTAGAMVLAIWLSPDRWQLLVAQIVGTAFVAFWIAFISRLSGSDVLAKLGLNYPELRPEASLHAELAALRGTIEAMERRLDR